MCGLTGFWKVPGDAEEAMISMGAAMSRSLLHRGPDDDGLWVDPAAGIALASRRLAILDLSPAGHMPMVSHCGRYVIAYNGEIYNFQDIRRELEGRGRKFVSNSDTEVLLDACAEWGVRDTLRRCNGMFAFALWDRKERKLTLARDRMGVKPLFYGWTGNALLFGSELKALRAYSGFAARLDRSSLALYLRLGYIPAPHCIYENVRKLLPGHYVTMSSPQDRASSTPYWSARDVVEGQLDGRPAPDIHEAADELEVLLRDSVRLRMLADVPVGAFLSGGIDSSLVVSMMQAQTTSTVKTFTIGFEEATHNEASYAKRVSQHLGTDHTELFVSSEAALQTIPLMSAIYDEPFADPSEIPTFLVSKLARESVTVSLSGDGGDELFGGYEEYILGAKRWKLLQAVPTPVRSMVEMGVRGMELLGNRRFRNVQDLLQVKTPEGMHRYHVSQWMRPAELVPQSSEHLTPFTDASLWADKMNDTERMMYLDLVTYLPEDILTKLDRASMAVSLEAREPLLDYRIIEYAWQLPLEYKINQGKGKRLLRLILNRYVPTELFERPKMGFGFPLRQWLRGPLRTWVEDLLDPAEMRRKGIFDPVPVRQAWQDHLNGTKNRAHELWGILMFQAWQQEWM